MSSAEFTEWMAFYSMEPFGWWADSRGPALVATMIQNRDLREDEQPVKMIDLMANDPPEPQTGPQMAQFARMLTIGLGGEDKKNG